MGRLGSQGAQFAHDAQPLFGSEAQVVRLVRALSFLEAIELADGKCPHRLILTHLLSSLTVRSPRPKPI